MTGSRTCTAQRFWSSGDGSDDATFQNRTASCVPPAVVIQGIGGEPATGSYSRPFEPVHTEAPEWPLSANSRQKSCGVDELSSQVAYDEQNVGAVTPVPVPVRWNWNM